MGIWQGIKQKYLSMVDNRGGFWPMIREPFAGAWQQGEEWKADDVSAFHAVYSCVTIIASDIAKMPLRLLKQSADGIYIKGNFKNINTVLKKPNHYQNHIQFKQWWITSKLFRGNTYVLKVRGQNNLVEKLYILDPLLVTVLVAPNGDVYYQLNTDHLSGLDQATITVPASEIIHDRMNCLFHPLVGVSPLYASGLAASQGLKIQNDSSRFFTNGARPSGILSAPGSISDDTANRLKTYWAENYTGNNSGKVAVLGDNLTFQTMRMTSVDAQLIEQLRITAEIVCSTFHVPAYKAIGGQVPPNNNIEALTTEYYSQCLQILIEDMELCLDEGLNVPEGFKTQLDLDVLFRMDSSTLVKTLAEGVKGSIFTPNGARQRLNLAPITGGDTIYMQQQNYSLDALSKRDSQPDPFATHTSSPAPSEPQPTPAKELESYATIFAAVVEKEIQLAISK